MNKKKTTLVIRPAARGGKYLGHDAANPQNCSALIALLDPRTEKLVTYAFAKAPTKQSAGPGNLMAPVSRAQPYAADDHTVHVALSVEIAQPTDFRVLVYGPLSFPDQARAAQADIAVLPGVDVGTTTQFPEGLVLEVPGLCISGVTHDWSRPQVTCTAKVTMMCGCQIHNDPTWPWPATDFSIQLVTAMRSGAVHHYPMTYDTASATPSTFSGTWPNQAAAGDTVEQAWIHASEPKLGNQGTYRIQPAARQRLPLPPEVEAILAAKNECRTSEPA